MIYKINLLPVLAASFALGIMAQPLLAANFEDFTYEDNGTSITITGYPPNAVGAVVIPATIIGKPVTTIGHYAFAGCKGITSVSIPNSITLIGGFAFEDCDGLSTVTIPNSVTSIEDYAFHFCDKLASVTISTGMSSIKDGTFEGCALTSVVIPNTIRTISFGAFRYCDYLTRVTISKGVTSIEEVAFQGCNGLTKVFIPDSVTDIGQSAFGSCDNLGSATFLGNAPTMGGGVFIFAKYGFTVYYMNGETGFTSPTWQGYPCILIGAAPEIAVLYPAGKNLVDGNGTKSLGAAAVGRSSSQTFTIRNTGTADLKNLRITKNGSHASNFIVTSPAKSTLAPGTFTTFKVKFKPSSKGTRNAAIHIISNDANENPFDIKLTGQGVAP